MMCKGIVLCLFLYCISNADIQVTELFRAETPEELEAALTDGYPMPWLAEILADTTIPEEDRYWLDCRMRAAIAIDLHTFFDTAGNHVTYNADWIMPGESYWRETLVINSPGFEANTNGFHGDDSRVAEPGILVDKYGQQIGKYAYVARLVDTSRDGSIAASSLFMVGCNYHLVLLYSDGSYCVSPIVMGYGRSCVSQSGEYVLLAARGKNDPGESDYIPPRAILVDRSGEIVWETELEMTPVGNHSPAISPDDRYCALVSQASSPQDRLELLLQVFDMRTGREAWRIENPVAARISFSPNSQFLDLSGREAYALSTEYGTEAWSNQIVDESSFPIADFMYLGQSNDGELYSGMIWPSSRLGPESVLMTLFDRSGNIMVSDNIYGDMSISPSGTLVLTENYQTGGDRSAAPLIVRRVVRAGE